MKLIDVFSSAFVHINSGDPISAIKESLHEINGATTIIISDIEEEDTKFYLQQSNELLEKIQDFNGGNSLKKIIGRLQIESTPAFETNQNIKGVPDRAIALDNGLLVGFINASLTPSNSDRTRAAGVIEPSYTSTSSGTSAQIDDNPLFYINAHCRNKAVLDEIYTVRVDLNTVAAGIATLPAALDLGSEIDIIVEAKKGFDLSGKDHHILKAVVDEIGTSVLFKFIPNKIGDGLIRILAYSNSLEIGHMDLQVTIMETQSLGIEVNTSSEIALSYRPQSIPDLTLQISQLELNGKPALLFRLTTSEKVEYPRVYLKPYGPYLLRCEPYSWFREFFSEIEDLAGVKDKRLIVSKLEEKGHELFNEIFPEEVRKILWSLRKKIKTLKIDSDEPWIPWELLKLTGEENGMSEDGPFFCEAFEITRWIPGHGAPRSNISLKKMAMILPSGSRLKFPHQEKKELEAMLIHAGHSLAMVPPRLVDIEDAFQQGYTAWHFSGHGVYPDTTNQQSSRIILDQSETLSPSFIYGKKANMGKSNPMVFLNACHLGKSGSSLTGLGGWAPRFLEIGASVFIGALWRTSDESAYKFSVRLYSELLKGETIAKAAHTARLSIKADGDPTWLAYSIYSDPFARLF